MTSLALLLWIVGAIVLQLTVFLGIAFWRHWQDYRALRVGAGPAASTLLPAEGAAWQGWRSFRVERKEVEDVDGCVCSFYLQPVDGEPLPPFRPGQFLTLHLEPPAGEALVRCYSLSDSPAADHYRITVKRVQAPPAAGTAGTLPPGRASSFLHDRIGVGSLLQVRAPVGHFCLDGSDDPLVLLAGGIGITPLLSMLAWSLERQPGREVWLFYGVRNGREVVRRAQLEALAEKHPNFHLHLCFSAPLPQEMPGRDYRHRGRIELPLLRLELPLAPAHFYLCGPTAMLESLVPALEDWGVPDERIHFEAFGPASVRRKAPQPPGESAAGLVVSFVRSGKEVRWQPEAGNLLAFAEANGVRIDSGCRAGGCGTCQTKIVAGEVAYRQAPDFDPQPGSCLPCVCTPKTHLSLEA